MTPVSTALFAGLGVGSASDACLAMQLALRPCIDHLVPIRLITSQWELPITIFMSPTHGITCKFSHLSQMRLAPGSGIVEHAT